MVKYETISVTPKAKTIIERLAKKYEMSLKDFTEAMAKYFDKTGTNPKDIKVLTVADELKKFKDSIISFIRKQESDFIKPTFGQMNTVIAKFLIYLEEEAPKREGYNKSQPFNLNTDFGSKQETLPLATKTIELGEYETLKSEHQKLQAKYDDMKKYFSSIVNNTNLGKTGMDQKPIVNLPMAEINSYKEFL